MGLFESLLNPLALRGVPGDGGRPRNLSLSLCILNGRDGKGDIDLLAVFPSVGGRKVIYSFSPTNFLQKLRNFILAIWWNQDGYGLAQDLLGGISIDLGSSSVPAGNFTIQGLTDDSVI
jgi:hypothetical protein